MASALAAAFWYQGLFFPNEEIWGGVAALAVTLAVLLARPDLAATPAWAFPMAAALSLPGAIDQESAHLGLLLLVGAVGVFLAGRWLAQSAGAQALSFSLLLACAAGSAFALLIAQGAVRYPAAYMGPALSGTLQYHNALGILAAMACLLGLGLAEGSGSRSVRAVGALGAGLGAVALSLSLSRGAYLVLAVFLLLWLAGLGLRRLPGGLLLALLALGLPLVGLRLAHGDVSAAEGAAALVGALAASFAPQQLAAHLAPRQALAVLLLALALVVAGAAVKGRSLERRLAALFPREVSARIASIGMQVDTLQARFVMLGIALQAAKARPLFGYGPGSWVDLYHRYQTAYFVANAPHSSLAKAELEDGLLGLLAFLTALALLARAAWRARGGPAWPLALAAGALAAHSLLDFDLDYPSLTWLLALGLGGVLPGPRAPSPLLRRSLWGLALLAALVSGAVGLRIARADSLGAAALQSERAGKDAQALALERAAFRWDPWNSAYPAAMGAIEEGAYASPAAALRDAALALRLRPDWADELLSACYYAEQAGAPSLPWARRLVRDQPLLGYGYPLLMQAEIGTAEQDLAAGRPAAAQAAARAALTFGQRFRKLQARLVFPPNALWTPQEAQAQALLATGEADYLLGQDGAARAFLLRAEESYATLQDADLFLVLLARRDGDAELLARLEARPWVRWLPANPTYRMLARTTLTKKAQPS